LYTQCAQPIAFHSREIREKLLKNNNMIFEFFGMKHAIPQIIAFVKLFCLKTYLGMIVMKIGHTSLLKRKKKAMVQ